MEEQVPNAIGMEGGRFVLRRSLNQRRLAAGALSQQSQAFERVFSLLAREEVVARSLSVVFNAVLATETT